MSNSHGSNADIIGNGYVLSPYLNSASFSANRDTAETTTFKKKSKTYIPGLKDTTMSCAGLYDGDLDAVDQVLSAALTTESFGLFSYIPEGQEVIGNRTYSLDTIETSYEVTSGVGDINQCSASMAAGNFGQFSRGFVAYPMTLTVAAGTSNPLDFGAATTTQMSLVIHAIVSSSLVLKLQSSTTSGGTWYDLPGTLTFATGRGSKRLVVPAQAIDRYTRVSWTGTGTFMAIIER